MTVGLAPNRLLLAAELQERSALRYTPAGVPAIDCLLSHESTLTEDGLARQVKLQIRALGIGSISRTLGGLALGQQALFAGFLASTRNGRGLLFHITELSESQ